MPANTDIIPVERSQISSLRNIIETTFMDTFAHLNTDENIKIYAAKALSVVKITAEFENENSYFYFVCSEGEQAGYLKLNVKGAQNETSFGNAVEIERIYVLKKFQGRGLGKALFNFSKKFAKDRNKDRLWLGVWDQNTNAIEFYKRQGLDVVSQHVFWLGKEQQIDLMMSVDV